MKIKSAKEFMEKAMALEDGRFKRLLLSFDLKDVCLFCHYFAPDVNDQRKGYRCRCIPMCPGVTISKECLDYIFKSLGE
jgi:hypothetical protein